MSKPIQKPLLVVLAATGLQGSSVIDWFYRHDPSTYRIRGTTRNASSAAAVALKEKYQGIELVQADTNDLDRLKVAFEGASVVFAYTDFAGCMAQIMKEQEGEGTVVARAAKVEVRQGKNIADAAAGVGGLERLVWSTLTDVKGRSGGKFDKVVHFDSKVEVWRYMNSLEGLTDKVSGVLMGTFADNVIRIGKVFEMEKESEGKYVHRAPVSGDTIIPYIDVRHDTGAFVSALIKAPAGLQVLGVSESLTSEEWTLLWAKEQGVKARYERTSVETLAKEDKLGMGDAMLGIFGFMDEFGYTGSDPEVLSPEEFEEKTGVEIPRRKIVEHIRSEDWSEVL